MFGPTLLPRTLEAALRDAGHAKVEVRRAALRDLVRHAGEARAADRVAEMLRTDDSTLVRADAALALADVGEARHVDAVAHAARDGEPRVRQMALVALGEIAEPAHAAARAAVLRALDAPEPALRYQGLVASRRVLGDDAEAHLVAAFDDDDDEVRYIAWRLAEERWLEMGDGKLSDALTAHAMAALDDHAAAVRAVAALLLARAGNTRGHAALVALLDQRSGRLPVEDEQAAVELAGELGLAAATTALERRAFGGFFLMRDPLSWHARVALARLGHERARREILRGLSAWTRDARTLSAAAAGRARLAESRPLLEDMRGDDRRADPAAVEEALAQLNEG